MVHHHHLVTPHPPGVGDMAGEVERGRGGGGGGVGFRAGEGKGGVAETHAEGEEGGPGVVSVGTTRCLRERHGLNAELVRVAAVVDGHGELAPAVLVAVECVRQGYRANLRRVERFHDGRCCVDEVIDGHNATVDENDHHRFTMRGRENLFGKRILDSRELCISSIHALVLLVFGLPQHQHCRISCRHELQRRCDTAGVAGSHVDSLCDGGCATDVES
mmetsp:Transcript_62313/g.147676  ORF Transcript_62313/g.147676 Transcript_62313/m.147676 type:complete len:218 (-) Transcript_62313:472-1125(-)